MRGGMGQGRLPPDEQEVQEARPRERPQERPEDAGVQPCRNREQRGGPREHGLEEEVRRQQGVLPEIAGPGLSEQVRRVDRGQRGDRQPGEREDARHPAPSEQAGQHVRGQHSGERGDDERAAHQPTRPLRAGEDQVEPFRMLEVGDQEGSGRGERGGGEDGSRPEPEGARPGQPPAEDPQQGHEVRAGGDPLGPGVEAHPPVPRGLMRDVIAQQRGRRGIVPSAGVAGGDLIGEPALLAPHEEAAFGAARGDRVEGRLMGAAIEELRQRRFLGAPDGDRLAVHDPRDQGSGIVEVADQDGLRRADHDAGRLEPHVDAVRAEVAFLRRMIVGVDEDGVVGAGGDAGFAADADGLVEVDDAVRPPVHRGGGAGGDAGGIVALVAAGHLKDPAGLGKCSDVDILHVGAGDRQRDLILGLARGRAGVTADAARVIDDFGPLHRAGRKGRRRRAAGRGLW